jgi:hypothetical protein
VIRLSDSDQELAEFARDFQQDIIATGDAEGGSRLRAEVFTGTVLEVLEEAGEIEDGNVCFHRERGIEVSGYGVDDDDTVNLFVSIYSGQVPPSSVTKTDVDTALRRARTFWERCRSGPYHSELEESSEAYDMALRLHSAAHRVQRLRIFVITDGVSRVDRLESESTESLTVIPSVWDIRRINQCVSSGQKREPIEVDFIERFGEALPCLSAPEESRGEYSAYLAIVPGPVLQELYSEFGPRLLELNVRSFLQARGKVNKGIRDTVLIQPDRFLAYNNGISATASDVELTKTADGAWGIARIRDLQIVNGGQTTASIYHAARRDKADLSHVFAQAKITVVPPERLEEIVPLISRFANSQNRISEADLSANEPFQIEVEKLSRSIWAPAVEGSQHQSRWFYERARGQYADGVARAGTPAQQRAFKAQNPSPQKFTKTDLAKFENTWDQLPHEVSKGAQKNFVLFTQRVQRRGLFVPDETYFRHLVAKAIMFRRAERIVTQQQFGGYRANIVAYTLALVSNKSAQRIDLEQIWRTQDISSAFGETVQAFSHGVYDVITDPPGGANVTEYCKREPCWARVRDLGLSLPAALEAELSARGAGSTAKRGLEAVQPEEQALITEVARTTSEEWFALSQWAKQTDNLQPWQRSLAFSLGKLARQGREPSRKQATQGKKILDEATRLGFAGAIAA